MLLILEMMRTKSKMHQISQKIKMIYIFEMNKQNFKRKAYIQMSRRIHSSAWKREYAAWIRWECTAMRASIIKSEIRMISGILYVTLTLTNI